MISKVRNNNVTNIINSNTTRVLKLTILASSRSGCGNPLIILRKFLNSMVPRVCNNNMSINRNCNTLWVEKLTIAVSNSTQFVFELCSCNNSSEFSQNMKNNVQHFSWC